MLPLSSTPSRPSSSKQLSLPFGMLSLPKKSSQGAPSADLSARVILWGGLVASSIAGRAFPGVLPSAVLSTPTLDPPLPPFLLRRRTREEETLTMCVGEFEKKIARKVRRSSHRFRASADCHHSNTKKTHTHTHLYRAYFAIFRDNLTLSGLSLSSSLSTSSWVQQINISSLFRPTCQLSGYCARRT